MIVKFIRCSTLIISSILLFLSITRNSATQPQSDFPLQSIQSSVNIAVFADPHYFDPELGNEGLAFEEYLERDRKMLAESDAIIQSIVDSLKAECPDIVLVPGDMTKDGELSSHIKIADYLNQLLEVGIKVFAIPGNHDINNHEAMRYHQEKSLKIPSITPEQFAFIYGKFGYLDAISTAPNSLSYIAEPVEGIWILGIDSCRYQENIGHSVTGGRLSEQTLKWIKEMLSRAKSEGKLVLGMMHHNLLEHFEGQREFFPDYIVEDSESIWKELADLGLKMIFTGHTHANDIVMKTTENKNFIIDIETGSTVTYPCPYRIIQIYDGQFLSIETKQIESINYDTGEMRFQDYALEILEESAKSKAIRELVDNHNLSMRKANMFAPMIKSAVVAHYKGNESPSIFTSATLKIAHITGSEETRKYIGLLRSLWKDLPPDDNQINVDLSTGRVY